MPLDSIAKLTHLTDTWHMTDTLPMVDWYTVYTVHTIDWYGTSPTLYQQHTTGTWSRWIYYKISTNAQPKVCNHLHSFITLSQKLVTISTNYCPVVDQLSTNQLTDCQPTHWLNIARLLTDSGLIDILTDISVKNTNSKHDTEYLKLRLQDSFYKNAFYVCTCTCNYCDELQKGKSHYLARPYKWSLIGAYSSIYQSIKKKYFKSLQIPRSCLPVNLCFALHTKSIK